MRQGPIILAIVVGTMGLMTAIYMFTFHFDLGEGLCGNTEVNRLASPDGTREAVLFERSCGATTDFSSQVSIVARGESIGRNSGNALIVDTDHGAASAGPWGGPLVEMLWTGNENLTLRYSPKAAVYASPQLAGGVRIRHLPDLRDRISPNVSR